jgi:tetratricopeptide (TPR) repeat protein
LPQFSHWAFISYSDSDRARAIWLQRVLETYAVPRRLVGRATPVGPAPRRLRPIFRDRTDMAAAANLTARIETALAQSAYLIVICSPRSANSRWVHEEISRFRRLHGDERILSVIVDGDPTGEHQNCFPPALRRAGSGGTVEWPEPVAADLRPGGDGPRMVRLKLVAGMLGIGLDELIRRDDQRRHRRLTIVTVLSLAGMAVAGTLATTAFLARNDAQHQRAHAEGLIEFMLTDLRKRLEPSGRLDMMDGVGRQTLQYYEAQDPRSLDAQSLGRRARALRLMGEISFQRGNLGQASINFEEAAATTLELVARAPRDAQKIFNHAQNVFWVGEVARQRGETQKAEISFQEYRSLAGRLINIDPGNDAWRSELVYAESALGVLLLQQGRAAEATVSFEDTLSIVDSLARRHPKDLDQQFELGQRHAWLADALQKQGRLAETRVHRLQELAIYRAVLQQDPTLRDAKYSTVVALQVLGRLAMIEAEVSEGLAYLEDAVAQAESLLAGERDNMDLSAVTADAQVDLGEALLADGKLEAARSADSRALDLITVALSHDGNVAHWRGYRDQAVLLEAAIAARSGEKNEALAIDQKLLFELQGARADDANTDTFWLLERARLQTGDDLAALGRFQEALEQWNAVARSLPASIDTYEPRLLMVLKAVDFRLGRAPDAEIIARRLRDLALPRQKG